MSYGNKQFNSVAGAPVVVGKPQLGFTPADRAYHYDLSCSDLDGGTWTVEYQPPGSKNWIEYEAGRGESDAAAIDMTPLVKTFRFSFANLGGGAAPTVNIAYRMRT